MTSDVLTKLAIQDPETRKLLDRYATDARFRIENLYKINSAETRQIIPLRYNEAQIRLYRKWKQFRDRRLPVRLVICKARRAGLSTGVESLIYDDTTTTPNTYSLIIANESKPSENLLTMCSTMWHNTPPYMIVEGHRINIRPELPPEFRSKPPADRIFFDAPLNSRIYLASAKSVDAYLSFGFQNIHATEASRYKDGHQLFRAVYPTLSKKENSALYIESTPNGQEGPGAWFYELCMDAANRKNSEYGEISLVFIPWHEMRKSFTIPFGSAAKREAFVKGLSKTELDIVKRFPHVSPEQLQFRRVVLAGLKGDEDMFAQEYPDDLATAFLMTGTSVFSRKAIRRLSENVRPPIWEGDVYWGKSDDANRHIPIHDAVKDAVFLKPVDAREQGRRPHNNTGSLRNIKVYRWPKRGDRLFIGADVGGGDPNTRDGDESVFQVGCMNELNRDEIIMTGRYFLNALDYAEVLAALCWGLVDLVGTRTIMPELAPEWTGPGVGLCTYLDKKSLYPKLYKYEQPGVSKMPASKHIGWESNAKTKPMMVEYTLRYVETGFVDIPDKATVLQMSSYRKHNDYGDAGSFGGAAGRHDDLVSALQIVVTLMRLRSQTHDPESQQPTVMGDGSIEIGTDPWDPFEARYGPVPGMPGLNMQELDDEALEEAAYYASGDEVGSGLSW